MGLSHCLLSLLTFNDMLFDLLAEGDENTMKLYNQTINIVLGIMGFVGMIIGDLCERKCLMYICGFMCFFFFTCFSVDSVQRIKNKLGMIKIMKTKKETNKYGYFGIFIFMAGCCLSVLLCKMNIHFNFLILFGILLGVIMRLIFCKE